MKRKGFAITALMVVFIGLAGGTTFAQNNISDYTSITDNKAVNNIEENSHCNNNEEVTKVDDSHCDNTEDMMGAMSNYDMVKMHNKMMGNEAPR